LKFQRLFCIAVLALSAGAARADKLIWIPTAETSRLQLEYNIEDNGDRQLITGQVGLFNKFELLVRDYIDFAGDDEIEVGGQFQILPEGIVTPGVAVGVWDVADEGPRGRRFFAVASYKVPVVDKLPLGMNNIKVHGGLGTNNLGPIFFGTQVGLPFALRFYLETDSEDFNVGLSWNPLRFLRLKAESWDGNAFFGVQLASPL
jgi:hypothetical protein